MCGLLRMVLLVLMVLSSNAAPGVEDCDLPERVKREELHQMVGVHWVVVEGFSDYPAGVELLLNASSSLVEIKPGHNNDTLLAVERNVVGGKCVNFRVNMSVPDPETSNHTLQLANVGVKEFDGKVFPYDDQGRADVYQSCSDCLLMIYHGVFGGTPGRMLLIYRREGKHLNAEELEAAKSVHRKLAECLKFNVPSQFTYDGKAEFCLER